MGIAISLWVATFLAQPECTVTSRTARSVIVEALRREKKENLPTGLLVAVILAESGGTPGAIGYHRHGCDVGAGQIYVSKCDIRRVRKFLDLRANLKQAARILVWSRRECTKHPNWRGCKPSLHGLYNSRSKTWGPRVLRIHKRLIKWISFRVKNVS